MDNYKKTISGTYERIGRQNLDWHIGSAAAALREVEGMEKALGVELPIKFRIQCYAALVAQLLEDGGEIK